MTAIYRPRQGAVQRLTPNAGNRRFVRGGKGVPKVVPSQADQGELELTDGVVGRPTGKPAIPPPTPVRERLRAVKDAVTGKTHTKVKAQK